jgi:hypothetical protein
MCTAEYVAYRRMSRRLKVNNRVLLQFRISKSEEFSRLPGQQKG